MTASTVAGRDLNVGPAREAPALDLTLRRLAGFADLEPDWDSYGGEPSSPIAREEAARWVEIVADLFGPRVGSAARPYSVAPLADGGVQLEWRGPKSLIELEIGPAGELAYLYLADETGDGPADQVDDATWPDVLRALLRAFVA